MSRVTVTTDSVIRSSLTNEMPEPGTVLFIGQITPTNSNLKWSVPIIIFYLRVDGTTRIHVVHVLKPVLKLVTSDSHFANPYSLNPN